MDRNHAIQYTIVGFIILGALVWIVIKIIRNSKRQNTNGCKGCALSEKCNSAESKNKECNKPGSM